MKLSLIVAMTAERVIGKDNQLPWHLPEDLKRFKALTMGKPIIMGRNTYESIGRPLPGRTNIVLSRDKTLSIDGVNVVHSLSEAMAQVASHDEVFVIGGASVFEEAYPKASNLYFTLIHESIEGDTYFPETDWEDAFEVYERSDHLSKGTPALKYSYVNARRLN